jgi:hypothetical protein
MYGAHHPELWDEVYFVHRQLLFSSLPAAWAWHKAAVHEMSSPGFKADLAHGIIGVPGASFQKPAR